MDALDLPTEETAREASEALRAFSSFREKRPTHVEVVAEGDGAASVTVPVEAFELFVQVLAHLANGHGVTVMPVKAELTTQQAADLLGVTRPTVVAIIDRGELACERTGTHRRIRMDDLLAFRQRRRREQLDAIASLYPPDDDLSSEDAVAEARRARKAVAAARRARQNGGSV